MALAVLSLVCSCSLEKDDGLNESGDSSDGTRSLGTYSLYIPSESNGPDLLISKATVTGRFGSREIPGSSISNPYIGGSSSGNITIIDLPDISPTDIQFIQFQFTGVSQGVYEFSPETVW